MGKQIKMMIADSGHMEKLFVELSSPYDVSTGGYFEWGIVSQEALPLTLTLYPRPDGEPMVLELDEVIATLQRAKQRLLGPLAPSE